MKAQRIPTTRTPQKTKRRFHSVTELTATAGLAPGALYTIAPADQLTVDELRNIITGIIPPRTLIKFSRMLTAALEADQERFRINTTASIDTTGASVIVGAGKIRRVRDHRI